MRSHTLSQTHSAFWQESREPTWPLFMSTLVNAVWAMWCLDCKSVSAWARQDETSGAGLAVITFSFQSIQSNVIPSSLDHPTVFTCSVLRLGLVVLPVLFCFRLCVSKSSRGIYVSLSPCSVSCWLISSFWATLAQDKRMGGGARKQMDEVYI